MIGHNDGIRTIVPLRTEYSNNSQWQGRTKGETERDEENYKLNTCHFLYSCLAKPEPGRNICSISKTPSLDVAASSAIIRVKSQPSLFHFLFPPISLSLTVSRFHRQPVKNARQVIKQMNWFLVQDKSKRRTVGKENNYYQQSKLHRNSTF